jgi:putative permease
MNILREWYERYISDPQVVILGVALILGFVFVMIFGKMLAPVLMAPLKRPTSWVRRASPRLYWYFSCSCRSWCLHCSGWCHDCPTR